MIPPPSPTPPPPPPQVCDESTMRLQGELEVLRARKSVLLCLSEQNYSLGTTTLSATSVSMFVRPLHAQSDTLPAQPCINCFKFRRRMKQKLKLQKKQANFLRVKLGRSVELNRRQTCIVLGVIVHAMSQVPSNDQKSSP